MLPTIVIVFAVLSCVQAKDGSDFISRAEFEERLSALEAQKRQSKYIVILMVER